MAVAKSDSFQRECHERANEANFLWFIRAIRPLGSFALKHAPYNRYCVNGLCYRHAAHTSVLPNKRKRVFETSKGIWELKMDKQDFHYCFPLLSIFGKAVQPISESGNRLFLLS